MKTFNKDELIHAANAAIKAVKQGAASATDTLKPRNGGEVVVAVVAPLPYAAAKTAKRALQMVQFGV